MVTLVNFSVFCAILMGQMGAQRVPSEMETRLRNTVDSVVRQLLPHLIRSGSDVNLSPECTGAIFSFISGLRNLDMWAFSMLDATGKLPSGIMEGTAMSLGSYDQCVNIGQPESKSKPPAGVVGQYCSLEIRPFKPNLTEVVAEIDNNQTAKSDQVKSTSSSLFSNPSLLNKARLRIGLCVPSMCTTEDLRQVADQGTKSLGVKFNLIRCETKHKVELDQVNYTVFGVFAAVLLIILFCTSVDVFHRREQKPGLAGQAVSITTRIVRTFSFTACTERFLSYRSSDPDISALNGIRFISVLWNILGNIYFLPYVIEYTQFTRRIAVTEFEDNFSYAPISNFMLSYEAPFFVSAVAVTYASLKRLRTSSKIRTLLRAVGEDFIRLFFVATTSTLIALAFSGTGSGPIWGDIVTPSNVICRRTWWRNLLLFSNLMNVRDMCIIHNWILYALVQVQIVGLIVLVPLIFKRKIGLFLNSIYFAASLVCTAILTYWFNLPPALDGVTRNYGGKATDFINFVEIRPYTHMSVYAIGVIVGIIIAEFKDVKIHKLVEAFGWFLCLGFFMTSVYSLMEYRNGEDLTLGSKLAYAALNRSAFALSLGWITFTCARSKKGLLKRVLGWKVFAVLDQLTFFVYCLHPVMILTQIGGLKERTFLNHENMVNNFFGMIMRAYLASFFLHTLVEQPVITLHRWVWSRGSIDDHLSGRKTPPRLNSRGISLKNIMILEPSALATTHQKSVD